MICRRPRFLNQHHFQTGNNDGTVDRVPHFQRKTGCEVRKEEAAARIYATTDKARGALKTEADAEGYEEFVVPDDVGGRYSVLTAVGLLPIAVAGADIDKLMAGAAAMRAECVNNDFEENESLKYAAARNILLRKGKGVEILANYEPRLHYVA